MELRPHTTALHCTICTRGTKNANGLQQKKRGQSMRLSVFLNLIIIPLCGVSLLADYHHHHH
jgi:hypothetical protein